MEPELVESLEVPCPSQATVLCSWGLGNELHVLPVAASSNTLQASRVRW